MHVLGTCIRRALDATLPLPSPASGKVVIYYPLCEQRGGLRLIFPARGGGEGLVQGMWNCAIMAGLGPKSVRGRARGEVMSILTEHRTMMARRRRSHSEHDLADMDARFHPRVSFGGFPERNHCVNDRAHLAGGDQRPDIAFNGLCDGRFVGDRT